MTGRSARVLEREARFASLAAAGMSAAEIAAAGQSTIAIVYKWARETGVPLVRGGSMESRAARQARADKMASMYRQGVTLAKIGQQFNLTRERVRQVLAKHGVKAEEGGQSVVAVSKRIRREQAREAKCLAEYGLPHAVLKQLRKDRVTHAFSSQRNHAAMRGIEWDLTFAQWFAIWQASGKLHLRGRGKGKYVMSRVSDAGGYALGNVHIQLATENSKEAVAKWQGKVKANRGVFCLYPGRELAWLAKVGKVNLGFHRTEAEAVAAREAHLKANPKTHHQGRGYAFCRGKDGTRDRYQVMVSGTYVGSYLTPEAALAARAAYLESHQPARKAAKVVA